MQNLSNYSNTGANVNRLSAQNQSIEHMQKYITELTLYINENNHKYNKNMQTLKQFYEDQVQVLQNEKDMVDENNVNLKNQINTVRDVASNSNRQLKERQEELRVTKENAEEFRQKLQSERRKIDQLYEQIKQLRQNSLKSVETTNKRVIQQQSKINELNISNRQKQGKNVQLTDHIYELEKKISERYSLPEKIRDVEKDNQKMRMELSVAKKKIGEVEQKLDYCQAELQKFKKQNQSLKIMKGNFVAEKNLQIQKKVKTEKQSSQYKIKKLEGQNQTLIYQIHQCESRLKVQKSQIEALQFQIKKQRQKYIQLQKQMRATMTNKDAYITEFSQLKQEYQGVIQRLQDSLIDYQKKNWSMQQQNKELNDQLQSLQQLLTEVKAINSMNPVKKQFRRLAEMEIMAKRREPQVIESPVKSKVQSYPFEADLGGEWQKLMSDIQKIKI